MGESSSVVTVVDESGVQWRLRTDRLPGRVLAVEADEESAVVWYEASSPDRFLMQREPWPRRMTVGEDGGLVVDRFGREWKAIGVRPDGSVGRLEDWHPADLWADYQDA